jgi:anti-sigma B factor antagonist
MVKNYGEVTIATLEETRLDAALSVRFKEGMREVAESDADNVVLDLGQVMFMDSSGLGAVVAVMKMMGREKTFRIAGLSPAVDKVFKLTRMDSVFKILASADEALNETHQSTG